LGISPNEHFKPDSLRAIAANKDLYVYVFLEAPLTAAEKQRWTAHFPEERLQFFGGK
jgi:hypothetical protein